MDGAVPVLSEGLVKVDFGGVTGLCGLIQFFTEHVSEVALSKYLQAFRIQRGVFDIRDTDLVPSQVEDDVGSAIDRSDPSCTSGSQ